MLAVSAGQPASLERWLACIDSLHTVPIALGLDRVRAVRAQLPSAISCPVITVGGTNGKGSTCAMLEMIFRCAGYRTGLYTSPHLARYNERVRIDGREVTDEELIDAFAAVEAARCGAMDASGQQPTLTYFEFGTLAALWLFARERPDVVILEVGLGGRLDAVNIVDADVPAVTSVDIDHVGYLGATREHIGFEKAGIYRAGRPAVCGEPNPPDSLVAHAVTIGAPLHLIGRDYGYANEGHQWRFRGSRGERYGLPIPALRGAYQMANAATALEVLDLLHRRLPVSAGAVREGLATVTLRGRFQVLPGRPTTVLDVAHNPHAARALAAALADMGYYPETIAVFAMLADKDIAGVIAAMRSRTDRWFVAALPGPRGASGEAMRDALLASGVPLASIRVYADVATAFVAACEVAGEADRIIAFGSFLTVAAALAALGKVRESRTPV
ncbi:MAG: bifunctional tetrahydrofolate synthase/dihydrofolate synthase [Burkholderiales bacterium]|nr:bifunctional tetrahydrofolate synthase/dihydrofolate synthase [Burkholderiales bacterium]